MDNLRGKATKAFLWDLFGSYGAQIISFVISIFLARLLAPEDFGLVGMSLVFIGMLQIFKDMGFASALIQSEDNTSLTYSSVFYLNVFAGIVLTILLYFGAPWIGRFYDNQTVTNLVRLLSITFFLSSFNIVQTTILRKSLNFKVLTFRGLIAQVISGFIAIIMAVNDFGVYALVAQQIIAAIVSTILLWKVTDWYPKFEFSWGEIKKLSSFSIYVFAATSFNKIIQQLDTLIIGKLFSPATLGYFSRANSLNNLITQHSAGSILKVFFPTLSQIKGDTERFNNVYLKIVSMVTSIAIFLTGISFLVGEELIIGLFGAKWRPSIPIFQILILKGFTYPISAMIVNAFLAKGKSKENFHYGNIRKVLQLVPFVFAYCGGFYPFLYASVGVAILALILNNLFVYLSLGVNIVDQVMTLLPSLIVASIFIFSLEYFLPPEYSYFWTGLKAFVFSLLYLTFLRLSKAPILREGNLLFDQIKKRFKLDKKN